MPCFMASRGFVILTFFPSTVTVPPVTGSAPKMARTLSLRPEPSRPVKPLTSPLAMWKSKGRLSLLDRSSAA